MSLIQTSGLQLATLNIIKDVDEAGNEITPKISFHSQIQLHKSGSEARGNNVRVVLFSQYTTNTSITTPHFTLEASRDTF